MEETIQPVALGLSDSTTDLISGGVAGMCGVIAGQPLDTIRIRQQQHISNSVGSVGRSILRREGTTAFYKGMAYPLITAGFQNAVVFNAYGIASRNLPMQASPLTNTFIAGSFAGLIQCAIVTPVDLLKIQLQVQRAMPGDPAYKGPVAMLQDIISRRGIRHGLFRGLGITAIRDVPSHGVYFACFEWTKGLLNTRNSPMTVLTAGGLAGVVSWLSVYGIDVVKSRIQADDAHMYKNWRDCVTQIYNKEGIRVFFNGLPVTLTRAFIVNGAIFTAYEACHSQITARKSI